MSGGDVDVEPSLSSQNTLGSGEPQLKFSKPNAAHGVVEHLHGEHGLAVVAEDKEVPEL